MRDKIVEAIQNMLDGEQSAESLDAVLTELVGSGCDQIDDIAATHDIYPYRDLIVTRKTIAKQIRRLLSDDVDLGELKQGWVDFVTLLDPGFEDGYEEILLDAVYTIDNFEDFEDSERELRDILEVIEA